MTVKSSFQKFIVIQVIIVLLLAPGISFGQKNEMLTYTSVQILNNRLAVNLGDTISVEGRYNSSSLYTHVYSDLYQIQPGYYRTGTVPLSYSCKARINKIFKLPGSSVLMLSVRDLTSENIFYIDLYDALVANEISLEGKKMLSRFTLFINYLKSQTDITDNTAICYINSFKYVKDNIDEFEKHRLIESAHKTCDTLLNRSIKNTDLLFFSSVELPEYDFSKKGFLLEKLPTEKAFALKLQKNDEAFLNFTNVPTELFIHLNEDSAETLIKYYKERKLERRLYFIYTYDLSDNDIQKVQEKQLGQSLYKDSYVQNGRVKSITFYNDNEFKIKAAEIFLDSADVKPEPTAVEEAIAASEVNESLQNQIIDASFPGGAASLKRYLQKNINPNAGTINHAPKGSYTVKVKFSIKEDGTITDIQNLTSYGYGMEEELIRVIKNGPRWSPAIKNGKNIITEKEQTVQFIVQ